jgi:site-specific DNA recombinase
MSKRVAVYARVSTIRQAESDISLPDQLAHARRYCEQRGWIITREFVDAGASARDDKRIELQKMMDAACVDASPFDIVLVHSQSRFFRDIIGYVGYKRRLSKHAVLLVSMTQDFGEGASADFAETIIAASDELNSAETAKHVTRTMLENARQGFWNGSMAPYGYRTVEVEKRGQRIKKHLQIEEREAAVVRQIFQLAREGDGIKGPMGIKDIASWLNNRGFRNRRGNLFYTGTVHVILTRESYTGVHFYNCNDSRTKRPRPKEEWIAVQIPQIIPLNEFHMVQKRLYARRPSVTPPRISTSDVLLTGLVRCECCGGPLMLRTGTGRSGGIYRYYACAANRLKGHLACKSPVAIPEGKLDTLVITGLADQLLTPDRLTTLLREANAHRKASTSGNQAKSAALKKELKNIEGQIDRLYGAIAEGIVSDTALLRQKLDGLNGRRDECLGLLESLTPDQPEIRHAFSRQQAAAMASNFKRKLLDAPKAVQKRYVHGLVSEIVVDRDKAVISGPPAAIAAAITAGALEGNVRTSVREWRTRRDSNS